MARDQLGGPPESAIYLWDWIAVGVIALCTFAFAMVATMTPNIIKEFTQSVLAVLFVVGAGYLQVEQPSVDHSVVWAIVGSIVGFYFGAKVGGSSP